MFFFGRSESSMVNGISIKFYFCCFPVSFLIRLILKLTLPILEIDNQYCIVLKGSYFVRWTKITISITYTWKLDKNTLTSRLKNLHQLFKGTFYDAGSLLLKTKLVFVGTEQYQEMINRKILKLLNGINRIRYIRK